MANLAPQLTNDGTDMMLAALQGDGITFTKICLGDGTSSDQQSMTDMDHKVITVVITEMTRTANYVLLTGRYTNSDVQTGFYAKELGVYAENTAGVEKLYAYRYSAQDVDYIPSPSSGRVVDTEISIIVSVGTVEDISAIIAEGTGYASEAALQNHVQNRSNPHHVTKENVGLGNVPNLAPSNMTIDFNTINTLQDVASGNTLATIVAKLQSAISFLRNHIANKNNPHSVTPSQIGAAASSHTHSASDVTSGTLPVARGGTGGANAATARSNLGACSVTDYTVNIPNAGWSGNAAPYKKTVTLTGILATDKPIIDAVQTGTWATDQAVREAWACITRISTAANQLLIEADSIPETSFYVQVRCIR